MIQGTSSHAGKSFLVAMLCKIFAERGYKVAPFKSQNTSLNSFVTKDGKEIARAQALQALAAGIEPAVEMNPILIKPKGDSRAQIIVNGKPFKDIEAGRYYEDFVLKRGMKIVEDAFKKLERRYDLIVIEGAGSPVEINLYDQDIANMRIADLTSAPVVLIADIDRGGVFASIYGTINLLKEKHRRRIKGIVINKFRGDMQILKPGIKAIEELVGKPVIGVIPYIKDLQLPNEDSVSLGQVSNEEREVDQVSIVVIKLPRISNFTDFDPLVHDRVNVRFVDRPEQVGYPDAIIVPGTKNTIEDLSWMRNKGFDEKIKTLYRKIPIIGICGGYQILGKRIIDEKGVENGSKEVIEGLGLLDIETRFTNYEKTTRQVKGKVIASNGLFEGLEGEVYGYEIHMGSTTLGKDAKPVFDIGTRYDGAVDGPGLVFGTYLHGVFDSPAFRQAFINFIRQRTGQTRGLQELKDPSDVWMKNIERASNIVSNTIDIGKITGWLNGL